MDGMGERLKRLMEERRLTKEELCRRSGVGEMTIRGCLLDYSMPSDEVCEALSMALGVSAAYLKGMSDVPSMREPVTKIPVFGEYPAATLTKEDIKKLHAVDYLTGTYGSGDMRDCYFVIVRDDTMLGARIAFGDKVLIHPGRMVSSGEIALVAVDGAEPVLRRIYIDGSIIRLVAEGRVPEECIYDSRINDIKLLGAVVLVLMYPQ